MKYARVSLFIVLCLFFFVDFGWSVGPFCLTIPVYGEYHDSSLGGTVRYNGTVRLTFRQPDPGAAGLVYDRSTVIAQAWCLNNGAGYTIYAIGQGDSIVSADSILEMSGTFLVLGGDMNPVSHGEVVMTCRVPGVAQLRSQAWLAFYGR